MEKKQTRNKPVIAVSLLLLFVVAALLVLFAMRPADQREGIVLPDPQKEDAEIEQFEEQLPAGDFVEINTDNVVTVLRSLEKPEFYHQVYVVTINSEKKSSARTVELWVNGTWTHAEISDGRAVKSVFTDGSTAWIWYSSDLNAVPIQLGDSLLPEDLLGIPNFDYQTSMEHAELQDAGYGLGENKEQYIFAQTEENDCTMRYRFSLDSGLLLQCTATERETVVYEVVQTAFDRLAYGDQSFEGRFCLPDGTVPFTSETRMLQP